MEAKELMIGDWVYNETFCGGKARQVFEIRERGGLTLKYSSMICGSNVIDISPIPLTAEIIEKNWFSRFFSEYKMRYDNGIISIVFSINKIDIDWIDIVDNEIGNIHLKNIRYVHELQHALRLCGLDELADNFKI